MPFGATLDLATLDATSGIRLIGETANDSSGADVAAAGDVNGDGIADLIVSSVNNGSARGMSYIIFGSATPFSASFDLGSLNGTNGFRIRGEAAGDRSGYSVASADVNGDGISDLLIGAQQASPNGVTSAGATYVVFGKSTGFDATVELSSLNGTNGFKISGEANFDRAGTISSAGDFNNDGYDDIIIGAAGAAPYGSPSGAAYLIYGRAGGFAANLDLSALAPTDGFRINGEAENDFAGQAVAGIGDINGDGFDDIAVTGTGIDGNGNSYSGGAWVILGTAANLGTNFNLSNLTGSNGFQINGVYSYDRVGTSISSAGDINGDGIDDLIVGAFNGFDHGMNPGVSYVVFGRNTATAGDFAADVNLYDLDGSNGFKLSGASGQDYAAFVAAAGDLNGDGIDDLIVVASGADPQGRTNAGAGYVLYGKITATAGSFAANVQLSGLTAATGLRIDGIAPGAPFTGLLAVAGIGDFNADGTDDLLIASRFGDPPGRDNAGISYVVYGQVPPVTFVGGGGNDTQSGGSQGDSLSGGGGNDVLSGMAGDDILDGGDLSDQLYGGDGADDLIGSGGGDILYGDAGADELSGGDGADKLFGGTGADLLNGGTGNDRMDGESDVDVLNGGAGNDYLDGGLGADIMSGGTENDVYIVDDLGDQVIELAGEGYDIIRTSIDGLTLADNVEAIEFQGSTHAGAFGNAGANNMQGNAGFNGLWGMDGVDTINGNDGDDQIVGGRDNDLLRGGLGADVFYVFGESIARPTLETDQIYDFSTAEGDRLNLGQIDANPFLDGDQGFRLVSAFTKHDAAHPELTGQITLTFAGGITTLRLDVNGDAKVDYQMKINGNVTGDSGGWII